MIKRILTICLLTQAIVSQNLPIVPNNILDTATRLKPIQAIIISYLGFEESDDNVDQLDDSEALAALKLKYDAISVSPNFEWIARYASDLSITKSNELRKEGEWSQLEDPGHLGGAFTAVCFSPDNKFLAASRSCIIPNALSKIDFVTVREQILTGKDPNKELSKLMEVSLDIWDLAARKKLKTLILKSTVDGLLFSPCQTKLICKCGNTIKIFDFSDIKKTLLINKIKHKNAQSVIASTDGLYLATNSHEDIKIWDAKKYVLLQTLKSPIDLHTVSFSADSLYIRGVQIIGNSEENSSSIAHTWKNQALEVALQGEEQDGELEELTEPNPVVKERCSPCTKTGCIVS